MRKTIILSICLLFQFVSIAAYGQASTIDSKILSRKITVGDCNIKYSHHDDGLWGGSINEVGIEGAVNYTLDNINLAIYCIRTNDFDNFFQQKNVRYDTKKKRWFFDYTIGSPQSIDEWVRQTSLTSLKISDASGYYLITRNYDEIDPKRTIFFDSCIVRKDLVICANGYIGSATGGKDLVTHKIVNWLSNIHFEKLEGQF